MIARRWCLIILVGIAAAGRAAAQVPPYCAGFAYLNLDPGPNDPCFSERPLQLPFSQLHAGQTTLSFELDFGDAGSRGLGMAGAFDAVADDSSAAATNPATLGQLASPEFSFESRSIAEAAEIRLFAEDSALAPAVVARSRRQSPKNLSNAAASWSGKYFSIAPYRQQLADLRLEAATPGAERGSTAAVELVATGVALAWRPSRFFSLGGSWVRYRGEARLTEQYPNTGSPPAESTTSIDDSADTFKAGLFWRPSRRFSLGAYFHQGASLAVRQQAIAGGVVVAEREAAPFELPRSYGAGLAFRPSESLLLACHWTRIDASHHRQIAGTLQDETLRRELDQLRLGIEYSFWQLRVAPALRLGVWRDPEPRPEGGDDRLHFTAGAGVVFASHWQIDAGVDHNDASGENIVSLSTVLRF